MLTHSAVKDQVSPANWLLRERSVIEVHDKPRVLTLVSLFIGSHWITRDAPLHLVSLQSVLLAKLSFVRCGCSSMSINLVSFPPKRLSRSSTFLTDRSTAIISNIFDITHAKWYSPGRDLWLGLLSTKQPTSISRFDMIG
jgi:hypothetical protein